jgi:transposase
MRESNGIDSILGDCSMAKAYSADMRERVIGRVESGASRREAAEHYEVSASTAVIWVKCFRETGRCAAKPRGGSTSPLEKHADFLLALIEVEPDLTLDEVVCAMRQQNIPGSRTAVWRFFQRHTASKKACAQPNRSARTWRGHADAGCASRAYSIRPGWCSSMRLLPTLGWRGCTAVAPAASDWWTMCRKVIGRRSPSWPLYAGMA